MYAISEYPEVFGSAACLSTHWIGTYNNDGNHTLDALYLPFQKKISEVLSEKGYDKNILLEGANHSENSWSQRLEIPLMYLFGKKSV
jgi:hypothetical protein